MLSSIKRMFERYRMVDGKTLLGATYFNPIWEDIDNRIVALEDLGIRVDAGIQDLVQFGIRRVDDFLKPAYDSIAGLADLGFLTAILQDDAHVTFSLGTQIVLVQEGPYRDQFRPTKHLTISVGGDPHKYAIAETGSYNRESGALELTILVISPALLAEPGPHQGIELAASAGSVAAMVVMLDQVIAAYEAVAADRAVVTIARADAVEARATAIDKAAIATAKAAEALASAEAAALFNPASYYTRSEVDSALSAKADAAAVSSALAALSPLVTVTSNANATAGQRIWCDTSGGAITITLPEDPASGAIVTIARLGDNAVTIARNGNAIAGATENLTVDTDKALVELTFVNGGWRVSSARSIA